MKDLCLRFTDTPTPAIAPAYLSCEGVSVNLGHITGGEGRRTKRCTSKQLGGLWHPWASLHSVGLHPLQTRTAKNLKTIKQQRGEE